MEIEKIIEYVQEKGKLFVIIAGSLLLGIFFIGLGKNLEAKDQEGIEPLEHYEELMVTEEQEEIKEIVTEVVEKEAQLPQELIVDVKGAVKLPGVYQMTLNSRVIDAIEQAGGFLETAEKNAINLAQVVEDQMVIYVPKVGEEGFDVQSMQPRSPSDISKDAGKTQVNINTAEKDTLMTLNGIGQSKADKIIQYREENGLFQTIEEIKNVSGIGEATFQNLKDSITVSP